MGSEKGDFAEGKFLVEKIKKYFSEPKPESDGSSGHRPPTEVTIKYIDPSYTIRAVPANAQDKYICTILAQGAVHGAMAGLTSFCVGLVNNRTCLIPIWLLDKYSPRVLNNKGRTWERVLEVTRQPNTVPQ